MTLHFTKLLLGCTLFALPVFFSSCIKDTCESPVTFTIFTPVFQDQAVARAAIRSTEPTEIVRPGKIYILGNYIFLNEIDRGIHVIDNTNPSSPKNISWIDIPGNMDLAIRGNTLYADFYTELVALDISNPLDVHVSGFKLGVFPVRSFSNNISVGGDGRIISDWVTRDTTILLDCENDKENVIIYTLDALAFNNSSVNAANAAPSPHGIGGSMARSTVVNDRLYTVSQTSLTSVDISNPSQPVVKNIIQLPWGVETIYPFRDELFIGSQRGMYRYDITQPDAPVQLGFVEHVRTCDPVIADDNYAYVTLRSGTACLGFINQLEVISLTTPQPGNQLPIVAIHPMTNPHGLGKDGDLLFICDGTAGLRVFNSEDVHHLIPLQVFPMDAYDVIVHDQRALVIASDGLYQFDYTNPLAITQLSKIPVTN